MSILIANINKLARNIPIRNRNISKNFNALLKTSSLNKSAESQNKPSVQNNENVKPINPIPAYEDINQTPATKVRVNKFEKYLVKKFSNTHYATIDDVPDSVNITQLNYAKDKGRARATVYLIGLTILGSLISVMIAKSHQHTRSSYSEDLIRKHAEYSKAHQDMMRTSHK